MGLLYEYIVNDIVILDEYTIYMKFFNNHWQSPRPIQYKDDFFKQFKYFIYFLLPFTSNIEA